MLVFNVLPMLKLLGVQNKTGFLTSKGVSYHTARYVVGGYTKSLNMKTVEQLCLALNCTPNDLITYYPDREDVPTTHALMSLNEERYKNEIAEGIQQLNLAELDMLKEQLRLILAHKNQQNDQPQ